MFELVGHAIGFVAEEIQGLVADITGVNDRARQGGSTWSTLGEVLGGVAGVIGSVLAGAIGVAALALRTAIAIVRDVVGAFRWLGTTIGETAAKIYLFFTETIPAAFKRVGGAVRTVFQPIVDFLTGVFDQIRDALDHMMSFLGRLVARIPARFRPGFLDSIVDAGKAADASIAARATRGAAPATALVPAVGASAIAGGVPTGGVFGGGLVGGAATRALPAAAEVRARAQISDDELDAIIARGIAASDNRPVQAHVTLTVDGETLARASARAERGVAARSFFPVPVGGR